MSTAYNVIIFSFALTGLILGIVALTKTPQIVADKNAIAALKQEIAQNTAAIANCITAGESIILQDIVPAKSGKTPNQGCEGLARFNSAKPTGPGVATNPPIWIPRLAHVGGPGSGPKGHVGGGCPYLDNDSRYKVSWRIQKSNSAN